MCPIMTFTTSLATIYTHQAMLSSAKQWLQRVLIVWFLICD